MFLKSVIPFKFPLYWFKEINKLVSDFCGVIENQESATKDYPDRGKEADWESQMFIIIIILLMMLGFFCCGPIQARAS